MSVHGSYCCTRHGCKYGDTECPVALGEEAQEYPCEECEDERGEWQPIETAPKDGSEFQSWWRTKTGDHGRWEPRTCYCEHSGFVVWGRVDYDMEGWREQNDLPDGCRPTHWMPLPEPPVETDEDAAP